MLRRLKKRVCLSIKKMERSNVTYASYYIIK